MLRKRSVTIAGHRTSFSLEQPFLDELATIATVRGLSLTALVGEVDKARPAGTNLSSALRLHVLDWVKRGRGAGSAAGQGVGQAPR